MGRGTITIEVDPITPEMTERLRQIFLTLIGSGGLNVRSGQTTMHFDHEGVLQLVETHEKKWLRKKQG